MRYAIAIAATAALFGAVVFAQDSSVDKPKGMDTTKPETARDPPASGPETARDDQQGTPQSAASDRTNTPETATDTPTSRDTRRTAEAANSSTNR